MSKQTRDTIGRTRAQTTETEQDGKQTRTDWDLVIYVAEHCEVCRFAYETADLIQKRFPQIAVRIVDIGKEPDCVPDMVFATPTYVLNGYLWSLGNPSVEKIEETFGEPVRS